MAWLNLHEEIAEEMFAFSSRYDEALDALERRRARQLAKQAERRRVVFSYPTRCEYCGAELPEYVRGSVRRFCGERCRQSMVWKRQREAANRSPLRTEWSRRQEMLAAQRRAAKMVTSAASTATRSMVVG